MILMNYTEDRQHARHHMAGSSLGHHPEVPAGVMPADTRAGAERSPPTWKKNQPGGWNRLLGGLAHRAGDRDLLLPLVHLEGVSLSGLIGFDGMKR